MTATATKQPAPAAVSTAPAEPIVQKDEHGRDVISGRGLVPQNFIQEGREDFTCKFLRLVSIDGTNPCAEVEVTAFDNLNERVIKYCRLLYYPGFASCDPGTSVWVRKIDGKQYLLAEDSSKCGRKLTPDEWNRMFNSKIGIPPMRYPSGQSRLLEVL